LGSKYSGHHASPDTLKEARAQWTRFAAALNRQILRSTAATSFALIGVIGLLVWVLVRTQIIRPMSRMANQFDQNAHRVRVETLQALRKHRWNRGFWYGGK